MNRTGCCITDCSHVGVVFVGGRWYCYDHKPVIFDELEVRRLDRRDSL